MVAVEAMAVIAITAAMNDFMDVFLFLLRLREGGVGHADSNEQGLNLELGLIPKARITGSLTNP